MKRLLSLTAFLIPLFISVASLKPPPHQTYRTDIFIPGTKDNPKGFYLHPWMDFNAMYDLLPGDTVGFLPGYYGEMNLGPGANVKGITFMVDPNNRDTVFMKWFGLGNNAQDCKLWGKSKYLDYGLKFSDSLHFALSWTATGKMEAAWFISDDNRIGAQLINIKGETYAKNEQDFYLHDVIIKNCWGEALYVGYAYDAAFLAKVKVERVKVIDAGWDGLQFKHCSSIEVYDCEVNGAGTKKKWGDDHGIIIGKNTNGATIKRNRIKGANGMGIWLGGFGTFTMDCNTFDGTAASIMTRNTITEEDEQKIGYQKFIFRNNELTNGSGVCISTVYADNNIPETIIAENNRAFGRWDVSRGITFTTFNNTPATVPICGSMVPLPIHESPTPAPRPQPKKKYLRAEFYDNNGWKLFTRQNISEQEAETMIRDSRYANGVYYIVFADKESFTKKIIKIK